MNKAKFLSTLVAIALATPFIAFSSNAIACDKCSKVSYVKKSCCVKRCYKPCCVYKYKRCCQPRCCKFVGTDCGYYRMGAFRYANDIGYGCGYGYCGYRLCGNTCGYYKVVYVR